MKRFQNLSKWMLIIPVLFSSFSSVKAQGTFQNLGFESAIVPNLSPGQFTNLPFAQVFPGWSGYLGSNGTSQAVYNAISEGNAAIALIGQNTQFESNNVIAGKYTAVLQAGNPGVQISAAIAQTGLVPAGTMSIQFGGIGDVGNLQVTFNGQNIPILALMPVSNYEQYGGDISEFAGTVGELRFTEQPSVADPFATAYLDLISFSVNPVPEPGTLTLAAIGGAGFWLLRRRSKSI